jgi:WD40 repeat protein/energy-coupling factor transporter ATP-binding protein EcfA2
MDEHSEARYDLFIVHAEADRAWVEGYLKPALGVEPARLITPPGFDLTATVPAEFERAVTSSRYTALVLSPAFLADRWSEFGEQLVQFASVEGGRGRLVAIQLHPVELPLRLRFRVALDCTDRTQWDDQAGRLRDLLDRPEPAAEEVPCPYPGMVPFRTEDARFFHGREDEIQSLLAQIRHHRFLLVIGPSGSGKSSLVTAGLLPRLDDPKHFARGTWRSLTMRPGEQPLGRLRDLLGGDPSQPDATLSALLAADPPAQRLLLVVDQLEELFALVKERTEQDRFLTALKALRSDARCTLIATMRADFYGDLMTSALWPVDRSQVFDVAPLRGEALRRAIVRPAEAVGVFLEPDLVERLIADAADEPGALPMLQEAMVLLWGLRDQRLLTREAYQALGREGRSGLAVAMATKADATLAELPPEQQRIARRVFLRLVQFGAGRPDTRRQLAVEELHSTADAPGQFEAVLGHLIRNRLLTPSADEAQGRRVDIAHEMLIAGWPSSQEWVRARREAEQTRRRLEQKAREWVRLGRGDGGLLDSTELPEAQRWLSGPDAQELGIDADLEGLVRASRAALEQEEQEREATRQRELQRERNLAAARKLTIRILGGALAGMGILLSWALYQQGQAKKNAATATANEKTAKKNEALADQRRREAERQARISRARQLAAQAQGASTASTRALLLAVEAAAATLRAGEGIEPAAEQALRDALARTSGIGAGQLKKDASAIALSDDRTRLAVGQSDGSVRLWVFGPDGEQGEPRVFRGHQLAVSAVGLSRDLRWLASGSDDKTVRLWDLSRPAGEAAVVLEGHDEMLSSLAFSPDGRWLATGSWPGDVSTPTIILWDLATPRIEAAAHPLRGRGQMVESLAFSPDSRRVAAATVDGTVEIWALPPTEPNPTPFIARGHVRPEQVMSVQFGADGRSLVSGGLDGTVRLWDAPPGESPKPTKVLNAGKSVHAVAMSEDRLWVACAVNEPDNYAKGHQVLIWGPGADGGTAPPIPLHHFEAPVASLKFAADRNSLIAVSRDGTTREWRLSPLAPTAAPLVVGGTRLSHQNALAVSRDGRRLAIGTESETVVVCDLTSPDPTAAALVLTIGAEGAEIPAPVPEGGPPIDRASEDTLRKLGEQEARSVKALAFSPNGRWLAGGTGGGKAILWDIEAQAPERGRRLLKEFSRSVDLVEVTPDGRWLVTTGRFNPEIVYWDLYARDPAALPVVLQDEWKSGSSATMASPYDRGRGITFSNQGRWMAVTFEREGMSSDIHLYDLAGIQPGRPPRPIAVEAEGEATQVAFDPAESTLYWGGNDGAVRAKALRDEGRAAPVSVFRHGPKYLIGIAISPDGRWFVTTDPSGFIIPGLTKTTRLWDLATGMPPKRSSVLVGKANKHLLGFSPDGRWLITDSDGTIEVWDLRSANPGHDFKTFRGHSRDVARVYFVEDKMISASFDSQAIRWDLRSENGDPNAIVFRGDDSWVDAAMIGDAGRWLVTSSYNSGVRLWPLRVEELMTLARPAAGRNFDPGEWEQAFPGEPYRLTFPRWP